MGNTSIAQNKVTETIFNSTPSGRTIAKDSERLPKDDDFMPDYEIKVM